MSEIPMPPPESERGTGAPESAFPPGLSPEEKVRVGWFSQPLENYNLPPEALACARILQGRAFAARGSAELNAFNNNAPLAAEDVSNIYANEAAELVKANPVVAQQLVEQSNNLYLKQALLDEQAKATDAAASTTGVSTPEEVSESPEPASDNTPPPVPENESTTLNPITQHEQSQVPPQPKQLEVGTVLTDTNSGEELTIQSIDENKDEIVLQKGDARVNLSLTGFRNQIGNENPPFTVKKPTEAAIDDTDEMSREEKGDKILKATLKNPEERTKDEQELIEAHFNTLAEDEELELSDELKEKIKNYKDLTPQEQHQLILEVAALQDKTTPEEEQHSPLREEVKDISKNIGQAIIKGDGASLKENLVRIKELLKSHPELLKLKKGLKTGFKGIGLTALILLGLFITAEAALFKVMGGMKSGK